MKLQSIGTAAFAALAFFHSPAAAECVIGSAPLYDPFAPYKDADAIVHKDSSFVFPAAIAGFRRQCEMTTDFRGDNFEIRYVRDFDQEQIEIKIAIVHLEELDAENHYKIVKPDLLSQYSSASVVSEGEYYVSGRPDIAAYQGIFDGDRAGVPWHFSVTALDYGYWDARLTAAYPQQIDSEAQQAIGELITGFQWQTPVDGAVAIVEP